MPFTDDIAHEGPQKKRRRRVAGGGAQDDCFTCRKRALQCDRKRPYCSQCLEVGKQCSGYKTTLTWGVGIASRGKLRGMSLPIAEDAASGTDCLSKSWRQNAAMNRIQQGNGVRSRKASRQSFTSNPVNIQPALAPAPASWQPTSSPMPIMNAASRSLHRLQTAVGPFTDEGSYSDSASSTGSFFEADYYTPVGSSGTYADHAFFKMESLPSPAQSNTVALFVEQLEHASPATMADESVDNLDLDGFDMGSTLIMNQKFLNPFSHMTPRMQFLVQYYDNNICPFLVAFDGPHNPYRAHILQMAVQNEGLQSALAALATNNMRMRRSYPKQAPNCDDDGADVEEMMYKQASVEHLNQQLSRPEAAHDDSVLATLLVLCLFHVCDSGFSKFRTQLAGVQKLLSMRASAQQSTFTSWVEMFFMWFDVMTSAVNDREMEIKGERLDMLEYSANLGALEQFSGCDGRLFKLLARLGRLNLLAQGRTVSDQEEKPDSHQSAMAGQHARPGRSLDAGDYANLDGNGWGSPIPPLSGQGRPAPDARSEFWLEWHDIRSRLQDWHMDLSSLYNSDIDTVRLGSEQGDMMHISEAFRHAALLYTERLAHPLLPSASHQFQQHVNRALLHMTALPITSCVNKFLLWPLFITGTECVDAGHRAVIRSRCIEIQRESGFYNNLSGLEVLEKVWADVDVGRSDASEMKARRRDSEFVGAGPQRQAFRWRIAMDRVDGEYLII